MSRYEITTLALLALNTIVLGVGFAVGVYQLRSAKKIHDAQHEWQRRISAQQALAEYSDAVDGSEVLKRFDYVDRADTIPLDEIRATFNDNPGLKVDLHKILNYYERLGRGVTQQIYDEEVIRAGRQAAMIRCFRAFESYIYDRRRTVGSPAAWCEFEEVVVRWRRERDARPDRLPVNAV